jgi:hypothetical protein
MPFHFNHRSRLIMSFLMIAVFQLLFNTSLFSQDDCASKLREAQKYYDQGMIEEIPQMLAPCMAGGFTKAQKIEAYKLIILSYLFNDDQFEAEKTMLEFLKKYPEYEIMPNDPIEFVYLFESYRTTSVFSFGITAGFNMTDPRIIEPFTTFDLRDADLTNTMRTGFLVGVGVGRYISRKMLLNIELYFSSSQYKFSDEISKPLPYNDGPNTLNSIVYQEKMYKVELPVTLAYEFKIKKFNYFLRAGVSVANITGVTGKPSRTYAADIAPEPGDYQDIGSYRKKMLYSGIVGAGIRYKVPRGVITVALRASLGINNIVRSDKRYDNQELSTRFNYLDDDFSLNTLSLSAGYYFSFYKPKKQR